MKNLADSIYIAFEQTLFHPNSLLLELVHRLDGFVVLRLHVVDLPLNNLSGDVAGLGVVEQHVVRQLVLISLTDTKRIDDHLVVLQELHIIESPESGGILVLFTARHSEIFAFYFIGQACDVVLAQR